MESPYSSGKFVPFYQSTRRHLPAYSDPNTQSRKSPDYYTKLNFFVPVKNMLIWRATTP